MQLPSIHTIGWLLCIKRAKKQTKYQSGPKNCCIVGRDIPKWMELLAACVLKWVSYGTDVESYISFLPQVSPLSILVHNLLATCWPLQDSTDCPAPWCLVVVHRHSIVQNRACTLPFSRGGIVVPVSKTVAVAVLPLHQTCLYTL